MGPVADDLRLTLQRADHLLQVLWQASVAPPAAAAPPDSPAGSHAAGEPGAPAAVRRRRGLPAVSVPVVLLGLGTLCVLVAAVVFVAVTWTDLSLGWRTTVLLAVTAAVTTAAVAAARARLRGATEALSVAASGLLLIDLVAGNSAGLPVLGLLHGTAFGWVVASVMAATGCAWVAAGRRTGVGTLLGAQCVVVLATGAMVVLTSVSWDHDDAWLGALVIPGAVLLAVVARWWRTPVVALWAVVVAATAWANLALAGLVRAVASDDTRDLVVGLDAFPLLTAAVVAAVLTSVPRLPEVVRVAAATAAVGGSAVVALLPLRDLDMPVSAVLVAVAAVVLALAALRAPAHWRTALRVVAATTTLLPAGLFVVDASAAVARVAAALSLFLSPALSSALSSAPSSSPLWAGASGLTDPVSVVASPAVLEGASAALVAGLCAVAAVLVSYGSSRRVVTAAACGAVAGGVTTVLLSPAPLLLVGSTLVAAAAASVLLLWVTRAWSWLSGVAVASGLGLVVALPSAGASALFLTAFGALLLLAAARVAEAVRAVTTAVAVGFLAVALEAACHLGDLALAEAGPWVLGLGCLAVAVGQVVAVRGVGGWRPGLEPAGALVVLVALAQSEASTGLLTWSLLASATVAVGVGVTVADRRVATCAGVLLVSAAASEAVSLTAAPPEWSAVAAATTATVWGVLAQVRTPRLARVPIEVTAGAVALLGLGGQVADALALTVGLTVVGAGLVVMSLVSPDRRRLSWAGGAVLVLASWVRLVDLDVSTVEAYTLPAAAALLVVGLVRMRRTPGTTSWRGLSAGLVLAMGPSLTVAVQEPVTARALVVGLVGVGLVLGGVRLRWGAPLLVGAVAVATLALVEIAPYASGLPRWVFFGSVGVALLGLGVTWEQRLRELRVMQRYALRLR